MKRKKALTIDLPIHITNHMVPSSYWQVVEAVLLPNIAPHLAWENSFAICYAENEWRVTHVETGSLVENHRFSALAIESARAALQRQTPAWMAAAVKKVMRKVKE